MLLVFTSFTTTATFTIITAITSVDASAAKPTSNVTNTKYLTITEHSYVESPLFTIVNGTVFNNSTTPMNSVKILVEFYDDNNNLVTANSGTVDFVVLQPRENSSFSVATELRDETIDRNIAKPGGDIGI